MRRVCSIAALVVLGAAGAHVAHAGTPAHCTRALPQAPAGLPAPMVATTNCGLYGLEPTGGVVYEGPWKSPVPPGMSWSPVDLSWSGFSNGHILIGRGQRLLWRSHDRYRGTHPGNIGEVVLGTRKLAFTYYTNFRRPPSLYLAGYKTRERRVGLAETPLVFTRGGELVTGQDRANGALLLRDGRGRLERRLAAHAADVEPDSATGSLVFRIRDRVLVFDGGQVRQLAYLPDVSITGSPWLELVGGLVAVSDKRRLVVLRYDGSVFASTALPARPASADRISSSIVANAAGTAVAFTTTSGNTAYGSHGTETVYELAAGQRQAQPLFSEELDFRICERMASLVWQGTWLLYADSEEHAAAIDSSGESAPVELSAVIAALPGFRADGDGRFDVAWG